MSQFLACSPTSWPYVVPGSRQAIADCGHEVWIAPSSQPLVDDGTVVPRCLPCTVQDPEFQESLAAHGMFATPDSRSELNEMIGVSATDQLFAQLGVKTIEP